MGSGHERQSMRPMGWCRNDAVVFVAMFPVRIRAALGVITALIIAFFSSTSALADGPWPNDPQGAQARSVADLYWIMFVAAVGVLAVGDGGIIYAGIKFRERPGHVAKQFHGNNFLELTWTIIPTIMVVSFSVLSWPKLDFINNTRGGDVGMVVQAQGQQWQWTFSYPHEDRFKLIDGSYLQTSEELHITVGTKVRVELSAKDVIHSFWIPSIGGTRATVPGRSTELWIQADKAGTFKGQCLEFCGDGHADMLITLFAHTSSYYDGWTVAALKDANRLRDPLTAKGRETFLSLACVGCHTVKGTNAGGKSGPDRW